MSGLVTPNGLITKFFFRFFLLLLVFRLIPCGEIPANHKKKFILKIRCFHGMNIIRCL